MKWKKHTFKTLLMAYSLTSFFLFVSPRTVVSAEILEAKKLSSIESIVASGDDAATALTVKLSSVATYTSYKTSSPLRLVVDFSQVSLGNISSPVVVNKGNFKTVKASRFDTASGVLTRLEIELVDDSEVSILPLPANPAVLKISFPYLTASTLSNGKNDFLAESAVVPESPTSILPSSNVATNENDIKVLSAISIDNKSITLSLSGPISKYNAFRLNKPERYIVDLLDVESGLPTRFIPLNASGVASARIGLYPDKVRVVFDSINGTFPEATVAKTDAGLVISLDANLSNENANTKLTSTMTGDQPINHVVPVEIKAENKSYVNPEVKPTQNKATLPENQVPALKKKNDFSPTSVEMIDFQIVDSLSRVSVKLNGDSNIEPPVQTPGYVTLIIRNSTLPKKLQRSLETRSFASPVLRITPFLVKTKKGYDTKIRIVMRVAADFVYHQEGDVLSIDFKHPNQMSSDKLFVESTVHKNKQTAIKTAEQDDSISSEHLPNLISANAPSSSAHTYKGRKVTLEFADAEVRKIFQLLSEVSNKNFVLGDDVTGAISIKLVNVPWDQALDIILETKGLEKREDGNIIIIKGKGKFKTQAEEELEIKRLAAMSIELKNETFSVNYADLATIASQFDKLKTPGRGQIASDSRTSKIIVKDTPQALSDMRSLLNQLDLPEKQVMIEARIVEATSTFTRSLGVSWGVHYRDGSASFLGINTLDNSFGGVTSPAVTSGQSGASGTNMGISFGRLASNIQLDMRLNAAASAGLVKIVSTPKIATLNNKTAKIVQGTQIPYTSATSDKIETKFVEAALSLEVTPHINANGTISMKIDAKNDAPGSSGSPPPISTKQATTEMLLRDGETTIIGGIYIDNEQNNDEGVPYLMDIPFLGNLFKTNTISKTKTELLIFITPRILN